MKGVLARIRLSFLAGLLVVVPVGVTAWVMVLLIGFLENFQPVWLLGQKIPGLGILLALTTTFLLGLVAESVIGRSLLGLYERILARVPFVSSVYNGIKQLMVQVFQSEKGFDKVVLVQWPRQGIYSIGFVTSKANIESGDGRVYSNVFLPSTPNPTTGFYFMSPADELVETDLTVEQAFKQLMSVGIVSPEASIHLSATSLGTTNVRELNG